MSPASPSLAKQSTVQVLISSADAAPEPLPGNWFLESDGTCGDPPDNSLTSSAAFIGFFILGLAVSTLAGICNFFSMNAMARSTQLFEHGPLSQFMIDVAASIVAPVLALTVFRQDDDLYTWHSFHVLVWVLLFGFRPGAIMGLTQVFVPGKPLCAASAMGQMAPESLFLVAGCVGVFFAENGSIVTVAYGAYRAAVFVGVAFVVLHLVLLLLMYFVYWLHKPDSKHAPYDEKYRVLMGLGGRIMIFVLGLLSFVGSFVLMIVASKMCGKLTGFIEAMCQVLQALLSLLLAIWKRSQPPRRNSQQLYG